MYRCIPIQPVFRTEGGSLVSSELPRFAELIAAGDLPLPSDLAEPELRNLANRVRECRRVVFVRFLARMVAQDIAQHRATLEKEGKGHLCCNLSSIRRSAGVS